MVLRGNAHRTRYRFLSRGEFSLHDDRWFTYPWGIDGGQPGRRSQKLLCRYSRVSEDGDDNAATRPVYLSSKCDGVRVDPGDVLEFITWGGGGLGDPDARSAATVALEVRRKLVSHAGARANYGVVIGPATGDVQAAETEVLRAARRARRVESPGIYNRGGSLDQL